MARLTHIIFVVLLETSKGFNTTITNGLNIPSDFYAKIEPFQKIGSKHYYIENENPLNWFKAVIKCHAMGGHLANLRTLEEVSALQHKIGSSMYWMDLIELPGKKVFHSFTTGEPKGEYPKWAKNQPTHSRGPEYCGRIHLSDKSIVLYDGPCTENFLFICESNLPLYIEVVTW